MSRKNHVITFKVSDEELEKIEDKFRLAGGKSMSRFIRQMILEGMVIVFSDEKLNKLISLVGNIANNINQIAVRVNSTGNVYADDMKQIQEEMSEIWRQLNYFQSLLQKLKP